MRTPARLRPLYFPAILLLLITAANGFRINGASKPRKLDETEESKCGGCPCSKPCIIPSPPPPPPEPEPEYCPPPPTPVNPPPPEPEYCPPPPAPVNPPPPEPEYCPPPQPPENPPPPTEYYPPPRRPRPVRPPPCTKYCPQPPSDIISMTGPPGTLYPAVGQQTYYNAGGRSSVVAPPGVLGGGLMALLMLW